MRSMVLLAAALSACTCSSSPPPAVVDNIVLADAGPNPWASPDGGPDECTAMCSNLFAVGCGEGADLDCAPTCRHVLADQLIALPIACLTAAATKGAARTCGAVTCP